MRLPLIICFLGLSSASAVASERDYSGLYLCKAEARTGIGSASKGWRGVVLEASRESFSVEVKLISRGWSSAGSAAKDMYRFNIASPSEQHGDYGNCLNINPPPDEELNVPIYDGRGDCGGAGGNWLFDLKYGRYERHDAGGYISRDKGDLRMSTISVGLCERLPPK